MWPKEVIGLDNMKFCKKDNSSSTNPFVTLFVAHVFNNIKCALEEKWQFAIGPCNYFLIANDIYD